MDSRAGSRSPVVSLTSDATVYIVTTDSDLRSCVLSAFDGHAAIDVSAVAPTAFRRNAAVAESIDCLLVDEQALSAVDAPVCSAMLASDVPVIAVLDQQSKQTEDRTVKENATDWLPRSIVVNYPGMLVKRVRYVLTVCREQTTQQTPDNQLVDAIGQTATWEVYNDVPVAIHIAAEDGTILSANRLLSEYTGLDRDSLVGRNVATIDAEHDWKDINAFWQTFSPAEEQTVETTLSRVDDDPLPVKLHVRRLDTPYDDRFLAAGIDISERQRRAQRLKERARQIKSLHSVTTEITECERKGQVFEQTVAAAESVLSFDRVVIDEARDGVLVKHTTSTTLAEEQYYGETPVDADDNLGAKAFRTGEAEIVADLRDTDVDPADSEFRSVLTVPIGSYGVFQAASTSVGAYDQTDLELAELLIAAVEQQLVQLERETQLREQTNRLQRQNKRLDQFTGIVGHDLRNPLSTAQGYLETVREDVDDQRLVIVSEELDRIGQLLDDLLTLSRQGQVVDEGEEVALDELVARCLRTVNASSATVEITADRTVHADRDRLAQIFENLFRNALDHAGEDVHITIGALDDGFYVADDGPGIPPDERETALEHGYSTVGENTGYGLSIVQEIVAAHGWELAITESDPGGARFEITGCD